jgi:hypothetical protein
MNPSVFSGLMEPPMFNIDASLVKASHITERFRFALRMDSFNVLNIITGPTRTPTCTLARSALPPTFW